MTNFYDQQRSATIAISHMLGEMLGKEGIEESTLIIAVLKKYSVSHRWVDRHIQKLYIDSGRVKRENGMLRRARS